MKLDENSPISRFQSFPAFHKQTNCDQGQSSERQDVAWEAWDQSDRLSSLDRISRVGRRGVLTVDVTDGRVLERLLPPLQHRAELVVDGPILRVLLHPHQLSRGIRSVSAIPEELQDDLDAVELLCDADGRWFM